MSHSKDDPDKLQNFVNSWLGECWEDTKLKTSEELVMERQTDLPELAAEEDNGLFDDTVVAVFNGR